MMVGFRVFVSECFESFFGIALPGNRVGKSQETASPVAKLAFGRLSQGLKRIVEKHNKGGYIGFRWADR